MQDYLYWLKTNMRDFMYDILGSSNIYSSQLNKIMDEHVTGLRDHGYILWKLLNLSLFLKRNDI